MTYGIREGEPDMLKKHASPLTDSFRLLMSGRASNRAMLTRKRAMKHPPPLNGHKLFCINNFTGSKCITSPFSRLYQQIWFYKNSSTL